MSDQTPHDASAGGPAHEYDPVWTYRGYRLRPSEFTTAMVHFYRAEIQRSNVWRTRLDNTTNWAVISTGAAISFSLSSPQNHHAVIAINTLLVTIFLWIEARRYRYYELWAARTRLLETEFFAPMFVPPFGPRAEWGEQLAETLLQPEFPISLWEAFGRRFRRNYMLVFLVLGAVWVLKVVLHPVPAITWIGFLTNARLGAIPGIIVLMVGLIYNGILFIIGFATISLREATGEVLPRYPTWATRFDFGLPRARKPGKKGVGAAIRREQYLAMIVTTHAVAIAAVVQSELKRGATSLAGQGMHTGQERDVLLVALAVTEISHLKALIVEHDPGAFVVVTPAHEVLGGGFDPLQPEVPPT